MKTTFFKCLILLPFLGACQTLNLRVVCSLPTEIKESSGLIVESPNRFWTHNDSGDKARLYQFDSTGILLRTVVVKKADNVDWEDIALDPQKHNFYIGDFGNNAQNRHDLTIYKIPLPQSETTFFQTDTVVAEKIAFSYPDQHNFPPHDSLKYFDAEALIATTDSIYIFTKDFDVVPYKGKTHIYRLPTQVGTYIAEPVYVYDTDDFFKYNGAITSAAFANNGTLLLMSYQKLWVFSNYPNRQFWLGHKRELTFGLTQFVQREAIAIAPWDSCTVYTTSEWHTTIGGGNLSTFNLCRILDKNKEIGTQKHALRISPTPSVSDMEIDISGDIFDNHILKIYNINGSEIAMKKIMAGETHISLQNQVFPTSGFYFCKLFSTEGMALDMKKVFILK